MIPFFDLAGTTSEVKSEVSASWQQLMESGQFIGGEAVQAFEREWAEFCGTTYAVGVANGTDALHLTLRAMGIGPGDDVVIPTNTFVATVEAVVLAGANPRFADVDPDTLLMTEQTLKAATTPATRAVIVVHLFGQMADMNALSRTASDLGIDVIEDAAQAQGATWRSDRAGSLGRAGCFSFYPGKNLGAFGDAGAVVTSDPLVAERLFSLRDHGRVPGEHCVHGGIGTNSRLDAIQAVVLSAKLRRLEAWNQARRSLIAVYRQLLDPDLVRLLEEADDAMGVHHLAVVRVRGREQVRAELARRGVATGVHYPTPCHVMTPYAGYCSAPLPVAEAAATEILSLPMYPHMAAGQAELVCAEINAVTLEVAPR
jgi:dTDP-4-amino-4,6-dideoxygalactose transaminase